MGIMKVKDLERNYIRPRPLPAVGSWIRKDYGPKNPNTWTQRCEVRAIVDDHILYRWESEEDGWSLHLMTPEEWTLGRKNIKVCEDEAGASGLPHDGL